MTETEMASLKTFADQIIKQGIAQENAVKNRSLDLNRRVVAMNLVWEKMSLVCQCAKLLFQNDASLYAQFLLVDDQPAEKPQLAINQQEHVQ